MNTKKVKLLRKQIKYHPTMPREYDFIVYKKWDSEKCQIVKMTTVELAPTDKRYMYQQLKKELESQGV